MQIPILPLVFWGIAHNDHSHLVSLRKESGVAFLVLKHESPSHQHGVVLDVLLTISAAEELDRDHLIVFLYAEEDSESFIDQISCSVYSSENVLSGSYRNLPFAMGGRDMAACVRKSLELEDLCSIALGLKQTVQMI